jgi:hypothetical protein
MTSVTVADFGRLVGHALAKQHLSVDPPGSGAGRKWDKLIGSILLNAHPVHRRVGVRDGAARGAQRGPEPAVARARGPDRPPIERCSVRLCWYASAGRPSSWPAGHRPWPEAA